MAKSDSELEDDFVEKGKGIKDPIRPFGREPFLRTASNVLATPIRALLKKKARIEIGRGRPIGARIKSKRVEDHSNYLASENPFSKPSSSFQLDAKEVRSF